jgi:hypothetical protein
VLIIQRGGEHGFDPQPEHPSRQGGHRRRRGGRRARRGGFGACAGRGIHDSTHGSIMCSRQIVDFCRPVPPGHGFRLANGVFTTIDGPGASLTVPYRSNNRGQVVGAYVVPDGTPGGRTHGFVLDKGKVRTLDGPGGALTELFGINDRGQIVGGYQDAGGKVRGLLRDAKGAFTTFDAPDAVSQTGGLDINDRRQIVGIFR